MNYRYFNYSLGESDSYYDNGKNDPDYKPTLDKEGIKQYKHDKKDRLEYESDNEQVNC